MNRASIANMSIGDGPVYVVGHRSPDSDTVCSAIAYARLLNMLGYPAEAAVNGPVNHETAFILKTAGVEAPPVLEDAAGKSIFLVDHSEYIQSTEGLVDAHIVGILDHNGIGTVSTGYQVVYEAKPIGATATIIWLDYLNYGLEIDRPTATLMLGAILSDTVNLKGTTVTEAGPAGGRRPCRNRRHRGCECLLSGTAPRGVVLRGHERRRDTLLRLQGVRG